MLALFLVEQVRKLGYNYQLRSNSATFILSYMLSSVILI